LKRRFYISLLLCILAGCETEPLQPEFNYDSELNVMGLLELNSESCELRLTATTPILETAATPSGISNATVTVQQGDQSVQLENVFEGTYIDRLQKLEYLAGKDYTLTLDASGFPVSRAVCTIPAKPQILQPQQAETVNAHSTLKVKWQAADSIAAGYIISVNGVSNTFTTTLFTTGTEIDIFPFLFAPPNVYILQVTAAESHYFRYVQLDELDDPHLNVSHAVGVFGAVAWAQVLVKAE